MSTAHGFGSVPRHFALTQTIVYHIRRLAARRSAEDRSTLCAPDQIIVTPQQAGRLHTIPLEETGKERSWAARQRGSYYIDARDQTALTNSR